MGWEWNCTRIVTVALLCAACGSDELGETGQGADFNEFGDDSPWDRFSPNASCGERDNRFASETEAYVDGGWIRGEYQEGDILSWQGIPFAATTGGENRFRPPQPVDCWNGVRDARSFGSSCAQLGLAGDEDCLTVNVWRPRQESETPRPVMVWIYGGANIA
ncbi:MAG: carboxylesterase family protein, partial [Myxococcota bacterium]